MPQYPLSKKSTASRSAPLQACKSCTGLPISFKEYSRHHVRQRNTALIRNDNYRTDFRRR